MRGDHHPPVPPRTSHWSQVTMGRYPRSYLVFEGSVVRAADEGAGSAVSRRVVLWSVALLGALGFLLAGLIGSSQAADPWSVQVIGTTGPDDVAIDSMTYDDAVAALQADSTAGGTTVLPVAPSGFPGLTTANAALDNDDTHFTLTVGGPVELLGSSAQMLVTAVWADADTDDAPSVTVAFRTEGASLSDFAPSLDAVDVGLSRTWTAFRLSLIHI